MQNVVSKNNLHEFKKYKGQVFNHFTLNMGICNTKESNKYTYPYIRSYSSPPVCDQVNLLFKSQAKLVKLGDNL